MGDALTSMNPTESFIIVRPAAPHGLITAESFPDTLK